MAFKPGSSSCTVGFFVILFPILTLSEESLSSMFKRSFPREIEVFSSLLSVIPCFLPSWLSAYSFWLNPCIIIAVSNMIIPIFFMILNLKLLLFSVMGRRRYLKSYGRGSDFLTGALNFRIFSRKFFARNLLNLLLPSSEVEGERVELFAISVLLTLIVFKSIPANTGTLLTFCSGYSVFFTRVSTC